MKCARLQLQERSRVKIKIEPPTQITLDKPRRYCQKRMVNPDHEEDPRWMDLWDRFHCNMNCVQIPDTLHNLQAQQETDDMVLTVQTLKFHGEVDQTKRPRTSFKYKTITDGNKHRMFVKQIVTENEYNDDDRSSELTYYYFDDYVKYLCNSDRSRPTSGKSSIFLRSIANKFKENKATQVETTQTVDGKKVRKCEPNNKNVTKKTPKAETKEEIRDVCDAIENAKITYEKTGKRKSLTISRAQSPETVQVIRVDVVCNYPSSSMISDYEETKKVESSPVHSIPAMGKLNVKKNHFTNKYLLTNTVKTLDESLCGGSKVTLFCKTFKLTDRTSKPSEKFNVGKNRKYTKSFKDITKNEAKVKNRK